MPGAIVAFLPRRGALLQRVCSRHRRLLTVSGLLYRSKPTLQGVLDGEIETDMLMRMSSLQVQYIKTEIEMSESRYEK